MEIRFSDLWEIFKRSLIAMLVGAILFGLGAYIYSANFARKVYSTDISLMMTYKGDEHADLEETSRSIVVASAILPTLVTIIPQDKFAGEILDICKNDLEYGYTPKQLASLLEVGYGDAGEIQYKTSFTLRINAFTADDCGVLAKCIRDNINTIMRKGLTTQYDLVNTTYVYDRGVQVSPHSGRNAVLFALIGAIIPYIAVLCISLADRRIYTEEDLKRTLEKCPILGQIPAMD